MQLMIYIHQLLVFFKIDTFKYTATSQRRSFNSFSLFYICLFQLFIFCYLFFKFSSTKKNHVYNLYCISSTLRFCYVMYYIVLEIFIGGRFLEDYFYCYSQQIIFAVANETLLPYSLIKRASKSQNL